jgi:hypothetical protein
MPLLPSWLTFRSRSGPRSNKELLDTIVGQQDRGPGSRRRMSPRRWSASFVLVCVGVPGAFAVAAAPHWSLSLEQVQEYAFYNQRKATGDCAIKGNINGRGERIYHVPGGRYYSATRIDPLWGERWFCSEADAVAAGWRRSRR